MEKIKSYLKLLSVRQNLILLGILFIVLGLGATTYLVRQQQELRKRAQEVCIQVCDPPTEVCTYPDEPDTCTEVPGECREVCEPAPPVCGDNICDPATEDVISCPMDCEVVCGDNICSSGSGENYITCPMDCEAPTTTPPPPIATLTPTAAPICGDNSCNRIGGENSISCPMDCYICGDQINPNEFCQTQHGTGSQCAEGNGLMVSFADGCTQSEPTTGIFTISGTVFVDSILQNGSQDPGEDVYHNGTTVTLMGPAGTDSKYFYLPYSGQYSFQNLTEGSYTVFLTDPTGYTSQYTEALANPHTVSLSPSVTDIDFSIIQSVGGTNQPDLVGSGPFFSLTLIKIGQSVTFSGAIINRGTAGTASQVTIANRFCIDNLDCFISINGRIGTDVNFTGSLPVGIVSSISSSTSWVATLGSHIAYFCTDINNTVVESIEENNCGSAWFNVLSSSPTSTPVPTSPGGGFPTATPPGGVLPTVTPGGPTVTPGGPTLPPGVPTATPGFIPTITAGGPTLPPGATGVPAGSTGLSLALALEGFPGTYAPARGMEIEPIWVELRSADKGNIGPIAGIVTYSAGTHTFQGTVNLGAAVSDGDYQLFVKGSSYLRRNLGTITIKSKTSNTVPYLRDKPLLACDLNGDNIVDGQDLNQIYTDIRVGPGSCDVVTKNGKCDIFDHNFCVHNFLKEGDTVR